MRAVRAGDQVAFEPPAILQRHSRFRNIDILYTAAKDQLRERTAEVFIHSELLQRIVEIGAMDQVERTLEPLQKLPHVNPKLLNPIAIILCESNAWIAAVRICVEAQTL
jgi:hypothetical protein